jgi:hypothetical protein
MSLLAPWSKASDLGVGLEKNLQCFSRKGFSLIKSWLYYALLSSHWSIASAAGSGVG